MIPLINAAVAKFLQDYCDVSRPVLLAFSGGPDSLALLHALLDYRQKFSLSLALAHVNHGWRAESNQEAETIASMAAKIGVELHLKTLQPGMLNGNLEAACRDERLRFFATLCAKYHYQAVLLAHHADDLAETILKRIFEGAALACLGGFKLVTKMETVALWRPLLPFAKTDIVRYLEEQGLAGFQDDTNLDPKFLRGRLRTKLLPYLSHFFGKSMRYTLCRLGAEANELKEYFNRRIIVYLKDLQKGAWGSFLDLSRQIPNERMDVKHLIRKLCELEGFGLSYQSLETATALFLDGAANKQVGVGNGRLYIDRYRLFACRVPVSPLFKQKKILDSENTLVYGTWKVTVQKYVPTELDLCNGWQAVWGGGAAVVLPAKQYEVAFPEPNAPYLQGMSLGKWWTDHKVPTFLRQHVPVICSEGKVWHEFLTGKKRTLSIEEQAIIIRLKAVLPTDNA